MKDKIKRKKILKWIRKNLEELGYEIVKRERIRNPEEKSSNFDTNLNITENNDFFFNKIWEIDKISGDTIESVKDPRKRKDIFKNITMEFKIIKNNSVATT